MTNNEITLSQNQTSILDVLIKDMGFHGEWCFYVAPEQDISLYGGFLPAMVFRNVQSYFSMNGPIYGDVPFIIGQTLDEAQARCRLMNQHAKLAGDVVDQILDSAGLSQA